NADLRSPFDRDAGVIALRQEPMRLWPLRVSDAAPRVLAHSPPLSNGPLRHAADGRGSSVRSPGRLVCILELAVIVFIVLPIFVICGIGGIFLAISPERSGRRADLSVSAALRRDRTEAGGKGGEIGDTADW